MATTSKGKGRPRTRGAKPSKARRRRGRPAWEIALLFPEQGQWTEEDYLALDTNQLVELVDGCIEVLPVPPPLHQRLVRFLFRLLDAFVRAHAKGEVFFAPLPVQLWPKQMREPDVVYVRPGRITDPRRPPEGADLVMEVVSEGEENRERDLVTKRAEYAKAKIGEYWVVDPEEKTVRVLRLSGKRYRVHGTFGPGDQAASALLPGFSVDVSALLTAGEGKAGDA